MRVTSLLRHLSGVTGLVVEGFSLEAQRLVLDVRPRYRRPRCGGCGHKRPGYDRSGMRSWRHLGIGDLTVLLRYAPRRVNCCRCGIRTEQVPWAALGSRFTQDFEERAAYLAQIADKTQTTRLLGIAWRTVGAIVQRVVHQRLDRERLKGLKHIGIDEFSCRRSRRYLTVIVDHDRGRVVWVGRQRGTAALAAFFEALGSQGCARLETITIHPSDNCQQALADYAPQATIAPRPLPLPAGRWNQA